MEPGVGGFTEMKTIVMEATANLLFKLVKVNRVGLP